MIVKNDEEEINFDEKTFKRRFKRVKWSERSTIRQNTRTIQSLQEKVSVKEGVLSEIKDGLLKDKCFSENLKTALGLSVILTKEK